MRRETFPLRVRRPVLVLFEIISILYTGLVMSIWDTFPDLSNYINCGTFYALVYSGYSFISLMIAIRIALFWIWDFLTRLSLKYNSVVNGIPVSNVRPDSIHMQSPVWFQKFMDGHADKFTVPNVALAFFLLWVAGTLIFFTFSKSIVDAVAQLSPRSPECLSVLSFGFRVGNILCIFVFSSLMMILYNMRQNRDNFGLRAEIAGVSGVVFILIFTSAVSWIDGSLAFFIESRIYQLFGGMVLGVIATYVVAYRVIIWSYEAGEQFPSWKKKLHRLHSWSIVFRSSKTPLPSRNETITDKFLEEEQKNEVISPNKGAEHVSVVQVQRRQLLQEMINDARGNALLEEFLTGEFAVESLMFINACRSFKDKYSKDEEHEQKFLQQELAEDAARIRDRFIYEDSRMCITISYGTRKDILTLLAFIPRQQSIEVGMQISLSNVIETPSKTYAGRALEDLKSITPDIFNRAYDEVQELLFKDSFARFVRTSLCKKYVSSKRENGPRNDVKEVESEVQSHECLSASIFLKVISCFPSSLLE
jgi:hypothetical protein